MNEILTTQELSIGYKYPNNNKVVAENISAILYSSELTCLIGPNGAGKSTLIKTIAGMQTPLSGSVWLGKECVHNLNALDLAKQVSVVLTDRVDTGYLSAYELVSLGRHPYTNWNGKLTSHDEGVINWAFSVTKSQHLANRTASELSDGERQRIMIARALAQEPTLMILDEPTAYLDLPNRVEILSLLKKLANNEHRTILLSTHDLDIALKIADKIWLLPADSTLTTGIPEELILNGSLQSAFQTDDIKFDNTTGAFTIQRNFTNKVHLTGNGIEYIWTKNALIREGFDVINDSNDDVLLIIEVKKQNGNIFWQIFFEGDSVNLENLSSAIIYVKEKAKQKE